MIRLLFESYYSRFPARYSFISHMSIVAFPQINVEIILEAHLYPFSGTCRPAGYHHHLRREASHEKILEILIEKQHSLHLLAQEHSEETFARWFSTRSGAAARKSADDFFQAGRSV